MFDIAYYETCARHVNLQVAKYYAGLLTMVGESKTIRCHFIHGKHVKYFLVSFSLAVVCLPHHNSSCVCFFIKFICIFWRAFGNMKLTLKGLLRLELSQIKSKVINILGWNIDFRVLFIAQKVVKGVFAHYPLFTRSKYGKMLVQTHFLLLFANNILLQNV